MSGSAKNIDIAIVGAGIMGLSLARELRNRFPDQQIVILEKEPQLGMHASGRNSGVLHSGIYYPENSLKGKLCAEGAKALAAYCEEQDLPIHSVGKVILPVRPEEDSQLDVLYQRGLKNGAQVEIIDTSQLRTIEPEAVSISGRALYSPNTAVFNPLAILNRMAKTLQEEGVEIRFEQHISQINSASGRLVSNGEALFFGHLFNTAGLYADKVATAFGVGRELTILPFKGLYSRLNPLSGLKLNGHVYPVPDLSVPFLGVHFTRSIDGEIYIGPTAIPALGRENYLGLTGLDLAELPQISLRLLQLYLQNRQGFRRFAHQESIRFYKPYFIKAAQALIPRLASSHLLKTEKVGIRAQLLDLNTMTLVMDFLVEQGERSTHILNAVSPAFTSAFSFSRFVLDCYFDGR